MSAEPGPLRAAAGGREPGPAALGEPTPPPAEQPGFGHEEETEEVSANDAALHRGSDFPARHRPVVSVQGEAPGEAARSRRAAGRCEAGRRRAAAAPRARCVLVCFCACVLVLAPCGDRESCESVRVRRAGLPPKGEGRAGTEAAPEIGRTWDFVRCVG